MSQVTQPKGIKPPRALRDRVTQLVKEQGAGGAAKTLGLSRHTVDRLLGGLSCYPATVAAAAARLGIALETGDR